MVKICIKKENDQIFITLNDKYNLKKKTCYNVLTDIKNMINLYEWLHLQHAYLQFNIVNNNNKKIYYLTPA